MTMAKSSRPRMPPSDYSLFQEVLSSLMVHKELRDGQFLCHCVEELTGLIFSHHEGLTTK